MPWSDAAYRRILAGESRQANKELGIPRCYESRNLGNFDGFKTDVTAALKALLQNKGVYLFGPVGTGKTHVAISLLNDWYAKKLQAAARQGHARPSGRFPSARFISTNELLLELKQNFSAKNGEPELLQKYSAFNLLVLDDLGAEPDRDWARQLINTLVDRRYRDVSPTIFTSNLDLAGLGKAFDDRMASRIAGTCAVIQLDGPDRRIRRVPEQQSLAVVNR